MAGVLDAETALILPKGCLDSSTYHKMRNAIIQAAIDHPDGVVVDVTALAVPSPSAWAAFTSARWHISRWPGTPMALVCARRARDAIAGFDVSRQLQLFESVGDAVAVLQDQRRGFRRRACGELPHTSASVRESRRLMEAWLTAWSRPELISIAKLVVTVFVENALTHTDSVPTVRLESVDDVVSVAVDDDSAVPAARRDRSARGGDDVSGLAIVAALCRDWGNAPTSSGKTVWATIGPENQL